MPILKTLYQTASTIRRKIKPRRTDNYSEITLVKDILANLDLVAVDIGAAKGLLPHWQFLPHIATVYQIEPREDACKELAKINKESGYPLDNCKIINAGLSMDGGEKILYVSNAPTGSSLYLIDPNESEDCAEYLDLRYLYPITQQLIKTQSISKLLDNYEETSVNLIKLDIQGAELDVMKGLDGNRMNSLLGIEVELGLHDLYPKKTRFSAANEFFESQGFDLFDVRVARVHLPHKGDHNYYQKKIFSTYGNSPTTSARIWEFDAVYFQKSSVLLRKNNPDILRKMVVVYCTYNFFLEAFALIEKAENLGIFSPADSSTIKQAIIDLHYIKNYRPWLADSKFMRFIRGKANAITFRSAPRWCQYMYQNYPNG